MYVGGIVPFSNPSAMLVFSEDSVQQINLTLIDLDNGLLEVCTHIRMHTFFCKSSFEF